MRSLIALIALAVALVNVGPPNATARTSQSEMTVSGGELPYPIELSVVDAKAFTRRINDPPQFEETPATSGPSYLLTTPYWSTVELDRDDGEDDSPLVNEAIYYQESGLIQASQSGEAVWLVIDPRQRVIVDRYIRLGEQGLLSAEPSTLEVLAAAASSEQITVEVGGRTVGSQATDEFWAEAADLPVTDLDPPQPPLPTDGAYWLVVTLREGRSVQFLYDPAARTLVDNLGSEEYEVTEALADLIAANRGEPAQIENEDGNGSPFWWAVMAGGGAAALLLALVIERRLKQKRT